jgi:hypothetical protein
MYLCTVRKLYAIFSFVLVLFVSTGSVGVNLYKSYCNMRGVSLTFLTAGNDPCLILPEESLKNCCAASNDVCSLDEKDNGCCSEEEIILLLELPFSEKVTEYSLFSWINLPIVLSFAPEIIGNVLRSGANSHNYQRPPPKLFGKSLLTFVSVWRI